MAVANQTECRAQQWPIFLAVSRKESNPVASSCGERHFIGNVERVCDTFHGTVAHTRELKPLRGVGARVCIRVRQRARVHVHATLLYARVHVCERIIPTRQRSTDNT